MTKLIKIIPAPTLKRSAKNPMNIIIEAANSEDSCDCTERIPAWILSLQLSVIFATPEGLRLFSIERTIINKIIAQKELKYSIKTPLDKPINAPKAKLILRNDDCELKRLSIFEE